MSNINDDLSRFVVATKWEDLPEPAVQEIKYLILDSIGCALAGITTDPGKMAVALAKRLGGPPESSIIGGGGKVSCCNAAFANGQLINTIDYDAMMPGGHAPPYIIPPPLALAESNGASGKDLILATAIGFEIAARISGSLTGGMIFEDGHFRWAQRSGQGSPNFGAAAAVGKLLKLDQNKMANALGIAGHLSQVLTWIRYTFSDHRPMTKYGVPGWQNTGAVMAALLAEMGYMGDTTVFDPKEGFWKFCGYDGGHPEKITIDLGKKWNFTQVRYKPFPCCSMFQNELSLFYHIMDQNNLKPEEIESVRMWGHPTLEAPCFTNRDLTNIVDVQFSPAYTFALAAHKVRIGPEWQDLETIREPRIIEFAKKVSYQMHPDYGKQPINAVEVVARGKIYREEKPTPPGLVLSGLKLDRDDVVAKFRHNASRILTQDKIRQAIAAILEMEQAEHTSEIMDLVN